MELNKAERTKVVLDSGLSRWVQDYISQRHHGNVNGAKETKRNIEDQIKKYDLDSNMVWFCHGDPERKD